MLFPQCLLSKVLVLVHKAKSKRAEKGHELPWPMRNQGLSYKALHIKML